MYPTPPYLYKILSHRYWDIGQGKKTLSLPAEDFVFIRLAAEEQLESLLCHEWADAPQLAIVKLRVDRLPGRLETEAEGYRLYEGCLPTEAIVEAKILYREPLCPSHSTQKRLGIATLGDPVLRKRARALTGEEIRSAEIQELIEMMTATMRAIPGVGLAAPQIGHSLQIIVIEDMDHSHLTQQQLAERSRFKVPYHVLINPVLTIETEERALFFEGCLSVPDLMGVVPRATHVKVTALNEKGEQVEVEGVGWYARILQHEIDHLHGTLNIDRAELATLTTEQNYLNIWRHRPVDKPSRF